MFDTCRWLNIVSAEGTIRTYPYGPKFTNSSRFPAVSGQTKNAFRIRSKRLRVEVEVLLTLDCGRVMVGLLQSNVSPLHENVPVVAGVADQAMPNLTTVEFARDSTEA